MEVRCKENCPRCESCKDCLGFQKILDIKNAGLVIYRHINRIDEFNKRCELLKSCINTREDIFIVHNTKDTQIKADECISDIDQSISCARCRELVQRAKKYLKDVPPIDKKGIISICDHCQQNRIKKRSLRYCCKCHEVLKKYHAEEVQQIEAKEQMKTWLSHTNKFENLITDKSTKKTLKCRSHSELYLKNICKTTLRTARPLEVRPMLDKGIRIIESVRSSVNDAKSESALKFSDSEYIKSKSVLIRPDSLLRIESYVSPSVITMDASFVDKSANKNEEELKLTTLKNIKGILQRDSSFVHKLKIRAGKSPSTLKKYYSEEDIFLSASGLKDRGIGKNFSYIFPKEINDEVRPLRRVKTSAELILDTQEMLRQRATDEKNKYEPKRKIFTARKTRSEGTRATTSDDEDSKKLVKKKKSEEREVRKENIKKIKPDIKESKTDKEKVQKEQKPKKEPESGSTKKDRTDQIRKEKEDKLQLLEEKKEKQERLKRDKDEKQERLKKEKEVKQREKQEQLRKEKEEKQRLKDIQQKFKEEKLKNKDEKNNKTDKVQIEPKQKLELLNMKKQQDDVDQSLKMETDRKKKEEAERKLKALEGSKAEKKIDQEKPNINKTQEEPTNKDLSIKQIKMRMPSPDDLILQLVKIRQAMKADDRARPKRLSEISVTPLMINDHKKLHKSRKKLNCAICVDSDLELDLENIVNTKTKPEITDIIVGNKIFKSKLPLRETIQTEEMIPVLYKTLYHEDIVPTQQEEHKQNITNPKAQISLLPVSYKYGEQEPPKGVIRYALSDRSFIDKGWTMLPTEKVVRKMNVYRMRPAHPEFDWFERNKNKRLMLYDTGEKLAEFDDNGRGRWFYRNGRIALDYYDAEEINAQQRFVIYGSGEPDDRGRYQPIAILATFDYLGNGVVFDHTGKIRLKYNQTEGVVLDRNIGPVSHWKWHTLNDPPVLQQVMIDTQLAHKDPDILKLGGPAADKVRPDNEEMLAIEFDNFIKEKSKKLSQKFKPFQIRTKALKINENFSLKVLDQANIYLIFRDGTTNIKINIGMILDHQEIVDTDTAEVGEVSNNLERFPARTDSLAGLQRSVAHAQRVERLRVERERRLRHPEPCSSADKLVSAASRPLKPKLLTVPSSSTLAKDECNCNCRKRSTCNIYYDTRFV